MAPAAAGKGFTVTVEFTATPGQPLSVGVTEYCTVPADVPVAERVCAMLVPVPSDEPDTLVAICVQLKIAPVGVLAKFIVVLLPEQNGVGLLFEIVTVGVGLTIKLV